MVNTMTTASEHAQALLTFIDDSPSPWHAVASCEQLLLQAGYGRLLESQRWSLQPGGAIMSREVMPLLLRFNVAICRWPMLACGLSGRIPILPGCVSSLSR